MLMKNLLQHFALDLQAARVNEESYVLLMQGPEKML
jgi:hypothetical protein